MYSRAFSMAGYDTVKRGYQTLEGVQTNNCEHNETVVPY